jgi:uncharacterized protein (TIGR03067 family)
MNLRMAGIGVGAFLLAAFTAAQADDAKTELEKLQGKWEVTAVVFDGTTTDNLKGVKGVFDKDKLSLIGDEGKREFSIKLDPTKKPKAIDMTALDGDCKDKTNPAIYQLEGDMLRLCMFNEPGNTKRPTELASKEGSKLLLMTFKRSK